MPDLPSGQWSQLLVGHQWPASATASVLSAAATERAALVSAYDGYADLLRSIHTGTLAAQEGLAAESARQSFRLGETRARDIAARNLAKQTSYASAQQWVNDLQTDLAAIADGGNSAIRRILDSSDPTPQKISAITQTVTEAQQHASIRAATCCANVCDAIQTVLTAGSADTSARAFARSHGVDLDRAFGSPNPEFIHAQVSALVTAPSDALSPGSLVDSFTTGSSAGAPLAAGTEALTAGAVSALRNAPDNSAADAVAATPVTAPPTAPGHTVITAAPPSPGPSPTATIATAATAAGLLPRYGADLRPAMKTIPPAPAVSVAAAPASAPVNAGTASALAHSSVTSRQPAPRAADAHRLHRLLNAVARQEPKLRWAIGDRDDGTTVLVTDLASGWVPPHIDIPAGIQLLEPGLRIGDATALLDDAVLTATYVPGRDPVHSGDEETMPMSTHARHTCAVDDLGWELSRATRWRDGLPRLAHTLAKATVAGTGCLGSEIALLREQLHVAARTVLDRYPGDINADEVGNWQLLAGVEALLDQDRILATYHFAWFRAHARIYEVDDLR